MNVPLPNVFLLGWGRLSVDVHFQGDLFVMRRRKK